MDEIVRFDNVTKRYANGHEALREVNFNLIRGEMLFVTGHSGAGKSSILRLIAMVDRPTHGQIFFDNQNLAKISQAKVPYLRRKMGVVFQNPNLLNSHTIFDNVALPLVIAGFRHQEIKKKVHAALDKVNLLGKEKLYPLDLSGGEQQRVGIARAVINKPILLLADEPTGNLDPELALEIMRLFEHFNQVGVSVIIATHDTGLITQFFYRVLHVENGATLKTDREVEYDN